ncbi:unnamed protein product [Ascophyllum nodosum]
MLLQAGNAVAAWIYLWMTFQLGFYESSDLLPRGPRLPPRHEARFISAFEDLMLRWEDSEVDFFVPQLAAVLMSKGVPSRNVYITQLLVRRLSADLQQRCYRNIGLAVQMMWQFEAAGRPPDDDGPAWNAFKNSYVLAAYNGDNLPEQLRVQRRAYSADSMVFVDALMNIGKALQKLPRKRRLGALDTELGRVNRMLLRRMQTRGASFQAPGVGVTGSDGSGGGREWLNELDVAALCPEVSHHALHLPIQVLKPGQAEGARAMRVLRLCRELCRVLTSKERAPYVVVAEVLQTSFRRVTLVYGSDRLYLEGGNAGVTCEDVINKRTLPRALQEELLRSRGQDGWEEQQYHGETVQDDEAKSPGLLAHMELEEADRMFFDRATTQYLTSGDSSSPNVKNMREALQVFGTPSVELEHMVRRQSPFGHLKGWKLAHFIVKAGEDFRMEALAMQVIRLVDNIFKREGLSLRLRPYAILCCGNLQGLMECITDAKSIDHIKKATLKTGGIRSFFGRMYMGKTSGLYGRAVDNFVRSLAGYAIVTYMLQVKDRHNGNIMLDTRGHIIHIDFGFILGSSPGWWNHESAPFKFTQDYMEIMGGPRSDKWERFRELFLTGFKAVQRHMREIEALIWPMFPSSDRRMATQQILFRKRFMDFQTDGEILRLIDDAVRSWTTGQYDDFQQTTNGYLK